MPITLTCKDAVSLIYFLEIATAELPKGLECKPKYRLHFVLSKDGRWSHFLRWWKTRFRSLLC